MKDSARAIAMSEYTILLSTVANESEASRIAAYLVERRLAACVNIVRGITSVYRWEGRIENAPELLLLVKTREEKREAAEEAIRSMHSYDLPEIIAVPITAGSAPYLGWLEAELAGDG